MKDGIHPTYHTAVPVTCSCGNKFSTGSTQEAIDTEICSNCHPFYTGKQKLLDTRGNVERFKKRRELAEKTAAEKKEKKPRKTRSSTSATLVK
jgi:large subunit ribosomal protein L31